jgi:hypothetical protein
MAYAAREHFEQNLVVPRNGYRKLFQLEWVGID